VFENTALFENRVQYGHFRHCEPTGRANARPMTGSAKQSIRSKGKVDCFVACAPRNDGRVSCPGRGAAFFTLLRRAGTQCTMGPGSAAHCFALGQVVSFWLPDAGVKFALRRACDGGKQARSPGRARSNRKPLRGECRVVPVNLW
jgi:hypothetical protein